MNCLQSYVQENYWEQINWTVLRIALYIFSVELLDCVVVWTPLGDPGRGSSCCDGEFGRGCLPINLCDHLYHILWELEEGLPWLQNFVMSGNYYSCDFSLISSFFFAWSWRCPHFWLLFSPPLLWSFILALSSSMALQGETLSDILVLLLSSPCSLPRYSSL